MSDVVWQALIAGCVAVLLAWMQLRNEAAAREIRRTLARTTDENRGSLKDLRDVTEATHTLVNSAMSAQLKVSAIALRRVAELTGHSDDEAAAKLAEEGYRVQAEKQRIVDQAKKPPIDVDREEGG